MARSSPRASAGLSMLLASMAPSAAPAPTSVCSSSMKRMIWPFDFFDLLQDGLEAVFELAAELRAGDHGAEIERDDALVLEDLGHVAADDAAGEAFDDGGFADAGLADQHGVVFGAAREHLHDAADLLVAADHGVELAAAGQLGEVAGVFFQRLVLALGVLVGDALASRARRRAPLRMASWLRPARPGAAAAGSLFWSASGEQQVLGRDEIVLEVFGLFEGLIEHLIEGVRSARLRGGSADFGQLGDGFLSLRFKLTDGHADFVEDGGNHALFVAEEDGEQCTGRISGLPFSWARVARAYCTASCDLTVNLSQRIAIKTPNDS